jgi:small ligand-binding sensory domain FIST
MHIQSAAANRGVLSQLLERVFEQVKTGPDAGPADLGILFASSHFEDELHLAAERVRHRTGVRALIGCCAEGVIGPEQEHEQDPTLALWLAHLPEVKVRPFHLTPADLESIDDADWLNHAGIDSADGPNFLLLGDPFSVDVQALLGGINQVLPGAAVVGGMASGCERPGQAALILNDEVPREGAVGVALSGNLVMETVVSQGCRPVGRPFVITRAERNVIHELGGKPPLQILSDIYQEAPKVDQKLLRQGVFLGRVINEQKPEFQHGDFLIRNLVGADDSSGAIAVGDLLRVGITVQFHVRDAQTADEDLRTLLAAHADRPPAGALLFSCNGRGTRMFEQPHHDVALLRKTLHAPPVAGFFCAGELGPVGGKNFIHGHTASIALFRPGG